MEKLLLALLVCPVAICMQDAAVERQSKSIEITTVSSIAQLSQKQSINLEELRAAAAKWNQPIVHYAVTEGHLEALELLKSAGIDLDMLDAEGQTAFNRAVRTGKLDAIRSLMGLGVDWHRQDGEGWTAMHVADSKAIKCLVKEYKIDLEILDNRGRTPLGLAAVFKEEMKMMRYYLLGAKLTALDGLAFIDPQGHETLQMIMAIEDALQRGDTPMQHELLDANFALYNLDLVEKLLKDPRSTIDINKKDAAGDVLLHRVVKERKALFVPILLNCPRIDTHITNSAGKTALQCTEPFIEQEVLQENAEYKLANNKMSLQYYTYVSIKNQIETHDRRICIALTLCKTGSHPRNPLPRELAYMIAMIKVGKDT